MEWGGDRLESQRSRKESRRLNNNINWRKNSWVFVGHEGKESEELFSYLTALPPTQPGESSRFTGNGWMG